MKEIMQILMERDGLTKVEAFQLVWDARDHVLAAMADCNVDMAENAIQAILGLEPDYIEAFM